MAGSRADLAAYADKIVIKLSQFPIMQKKDPRTMDTEILCFVLNHYSAVVMIFFLLYEPHALQTLCGTIKAPQLLHFTRFGAVIFQFALRLSLLALECLFFGQIAPIVTPP